MSRSSAAGASGYSHGKSANNAGSRDAMRAQNQRDVFQEVHRRGPISRADIANALHLSPATVTNITADLIARGLLFEAREAVATGVGRRAILLEVDYDRARVAGVKLSNVGITCAVTNLNAEVQETAAASLGDTEPARTFALNVQQLGFTVVFFALAVVAWRRFGAPYGASLGVPGPQTL